MIVGYARTSTADQEAGFEAQKRELAQLGCERVFAEQISSVAQRPELDRLLDFVREGDVVLATKLDRLARSMKDTTSIVDKIRAKGAQLRIPGLVDTGDSATGGLVLHIFAAVAEFEKRMMLERQREGIAKAKADGKYKGRKPTAQAKAADVHKLIAEGCKPTAIARALGISRMSVYRILKAASTDAMLANA